MDRFIREGIFVVDTQRELTSLMFNSMSTQDKWITWLNKKSEGKSCILEIENSDGDMIVSCQITIEHDNSITVSRMQGEGSLADIDVDDIYDTPHYKMRIQI